MSTVTISLNDDLLKKSRKYAEEHNTSLNDLIRTLLLKTVENNQRQNIDELLNLMDKNSFSLKGKKFSREETYER